MMQNVTIVLGTRDDAEEVYGVFYDAKRAQKFRHYLLGLKVESRTQEASLMTYMDEEADFALMYKP